MHIMTPLDHSKTTRELGWAPRATPEAIADAAHFFHDQRKGPRHPPDVEETVQRRAVT
ncbi:hypothetical protein [Mycobacterium sp.]|uniref:hypothetical protein n=1 Tax=Mycobacterium sp. TaxID=1785 RepID=UPI003C789985